MGIDHRHLNEVADFYDTRRLTFSEQLKNSRATQAKIKALVRSPTEISQARHEAGQARMEAELRRVSEHFEHQHRHKGTREVYASSAIYSGPSAKKGQGTSKDPLMRMQGQGAGRTDWRGLVRLDPKFQALLDGNQARNYRKGREEILEKIRGLRFKFKKQTENGTPHVSVLNRIGHLENVMRHGGGGAL